MPETTPVFLLPGTLPYADDCYPSSPNDLNVAIVTRIQAFLDETFPGVYVGPAAPPPNMRSRPWFNTTVARWYTWINGGWMRQYTPEAGSGVLWMWEGSAGDLETFDGGSAGAVGDSTGPLWEVDHDFDNRIPIGAGTTAVNVNAGSVNNLVTLITANLPVHYHTFGIEQSDLSGTAEPGMVYSDGNSAVFTSALSPTAFAKTRTNINGGLSNAVPDAFSILPAVRGTYMIKRTARIWVSSPY